MTEGSTTEVRVVVLLLTILVTCHNSSGCIVTLLLRSGSVSLLVVLDRNRKGDLQHRREHHTR